MNNNLVPTVITDRNGKQTTVHKKPSPSTGTNLMSVPAPVGALKTFRDSSALKNVSRILYSNLSRTGHESITRAEVESFLNGYSPSVADEVLRNRGNRDDKTRGIAHFITTGTNPPEALLRDMLVHIVGMETHDLSSDEAREMTASLSYYERVMPDLFTPLVEGEPYPYERMEQGAAIMSTILAIHNSSTSEDRDNKTFLHDENINFGEGYEGRAGFITHDLELIRLSVAQRHSPAIAIMIRELSPATPEKIKEILKSVAPSLNEGLL